MVFIIVNNTMIPANLSPSNREIKREFAFFWPKTQLDLRDHGAVGSRFEGVIRQNIVHVPIIRVRKFKTEFYHPANLSVCITYRMHI